MDLDDYMTEKNLTMPKALNLNSLQFGEDNTNQSKHIGDWPGIGFI